MKRVVRFLMKIIFCHVIYRVRYENLENVNQFEKCVICPNHSHIFDPVWIYVKVDKLHTMAKSELFENKISAFVMRFLGGFPVRRGENDVKSLIYAIKVLKNNEKSRLLIFAEGGILKPDKRRKQITDGATFIAAKTELPIVPAHITENPKLFSKIVVKFGRPMYIPQELIKDKEKLSEKSHELLKIMYAME